MKINHKILLIIFAFLFSIDTFAEGDVEIYVYNKSGHTIEVRFYPVSMIFNGYGMYNLIAKHRNAGSDYLNTAALERNGGNAEYFWTLQNNAGSIGFYDDGLYVETQGDDIPIPTSPCFGYGTYKLEVHHFLAPPYCLIEYWDSCLIERDYNSGGPTEKDLKINIFGRGPLGTNFSHIFEYQFTGNNFPINVISMPDKMPGVPADNYVWPYYKIEYWHPLGLHTFYRNKIYGHPAYGNFFVYKYWSDNPVYNIYNIIPIDSRKYCDLNYPNIIPPLTDDQNQVFPGLMNSSTDIDDRQGILTLNLKIQKDVHTSNELTFPQTNYGYVPPIPLIIDNNSTLVIEHDISLTLKNISNEIPGVFLFINKTNGNLVLENNSHINIGEIPIYSGFTNRNKVLLECNSKLVLGTNTSFEVYPGGVFCGLGANITGTLHINYHNGPFKYVYAPCTPCFPTALYHDSTQVVFLDSTEMEIPDNTELSFSDPTTMLVMSPHSKLIFGNNSKLSFTNGARLIADNTTFTSLDSTSTWDGIYLEGNSNDTITNCTFENAANGINIIDKTSMTAEQPSTEISNCTFNNTTNIQLNNAVYINNSNNVLLKNNIVSSTVLASGYVSGILAEYCPTGVLNIVNNNISNCLTGISVIQSSPYIAGNTLTGIESTGKGIFLDNSNGTIKYNIVSNFTNSLVCMYSSPYLLKNTFRNASEKNLDISTSSVPVMHPVTSDNLLNWLAGSNTITGAPYYEAIHIDEDAYVDMDGGYNNTSVNNANYLSGTFPSNMTEMSVAGNWWGEVPDPEKFNVTGGSIIYEPTYQGAPPEPDYYDLTDIGFGLYDTVYVDDLGDTPGAENLFMQAYKKETTNQYDNAISLYKQVITNYRTSPFAAVSLSKIFNCYEKKGSSISEYQLLQNYMLQVKNNQIYLKTLKDIAEDYVIKSKVKMGYVQSAISDYLQIYQLNQNNYKGLHALLNKEILTQMLEDTTDTPNGNSLSIQQHKQELMSLILGKELIKTNNITNYLPKEFRLYQNYPNPFNPITKIKYVIPNDGIVSFVVYDILGREIYSNSIYRKAGSYDFSFDGSNLASGLYFYRIEAGKYAETKKMVLIK